MVGQRKETKKTLEDDDMKTWSIQINALEDMPLSEWEQGFIANVSDWCIRNGKRLSDKQSEILEKIYRRFF